MRFKTIEKIKFRMQGRSVPVIRVSDIEKDGKVHSVQFVGQVKKRPNSLIRTWDSTGWELPPGQTMITIIQENGIQETGYAVSENGRAVDLFTRPCYLPNVEDIVGKFATADDIADNMDLQKSTKYILIGAIFGTGLGTFILGPLLQGLMS